MVKATALAAPTSMAFSHASIETYPLPASGSVRVSDSGCKGLALRITAKGVKTFTARHQRAGKRVLTSIGTYPAMSVEEAREKATALVSGEQEGPSMRTVSDLFDNVYWPLREKQVRPNTAYNTRCQWQKRIVSHIGHLPVSKITKRDITTMQDQWRADLKSIDVPNMVVSHFFNWLAEREYILASPVPRTKIKRHTRDRVLTMDELRELWDWADHWSSGGYYADAGATLKLWLLTGLRRREVTSAEWSEFPANIREGFIPAGANADEESIPVWRIPAERMKGKRDHVVPISAPMARVLQHLPDIRTSEQWVFPNAQKTGPTQRGWQVIAKDWIPIEDFTIRDIRRSLATQWATRLGVSDDVIGLALNHAPRSITASVYQRSLRLKERLELQQRWYDLLING